VCGAGRRQPRQIWRKGPDYKQDDESHKSRIWPRRWPSVTSRQGSQPAHARKQTRTNLIRRITVPDWLALTPNRPWKIGLLAKWSIVAPTAGLDRCDPLPNTPAVSALDLLPGAGRRGQRLNPPDLTWTMRPLKDVFSTENLPAQSPTGSSPASHKRSSIWVAGRDVLVYLALKEGPEP